MWNDRLRPNRLRADQRRTFQRYIRWDVRPYSARYGAALANGIERLPLTDLQSAGDGRDYVLRPTPETVRSAASPADRLRAWTQTKRRLAAVHIDPDYKPVHWMLAGAVPVGYSATDMERLTELGRRWLETAGVRSHDVVVSVLPPGPSVGFWQLSLGARRGGVTAMMLTPSATGEQVARLHPTVVAGRPTDLFHLAPNLGGVHTVLAVGEPLDGAARRRLEEVLPDVKVVAAWAPPGVRALWTECAGGDAFHTWPDSEFLEVLDPLSGVPVREGADGELVWSALGWHGTVLLRLRTGRHGEVISGSRCLTCGRTTPRLRVSPTLPPFAAILDAETAVAAWQAEVRIDEGAEELVVFLAPTAKGDPTRLLRELDRQLSVTQFVVMTKAAIEARRAEHGGLAVVDLR